MTTLPTSTESFSDEQVIKIDQYINLDDQFNYDSENEIKYKLKVSYLDKLMKYFMYKVPFENISVQNKVPIDLTLDGLYQKIITEHRGGYCYELNTFFKHYLIKKGFEAYNVSATIITPKGRSREDSHMSTIVCINHEYYIADVGFGDLPVSAIPISTANDHDIKLVNDINGKYRAIQVSDDSILVQKEVENHFETLYESTFKPKVIHYFKSSIEYNQVNPESIFVRQLLVTMPKPFGRVTMTHNNLTLSKAEMKNIVPVTRDNYQQLLNECFGINIKINRLEK
ncbi:arylamine N-acetyltransferase family protein [Macrococcus animalis]